jgi:hypothetical protein
MLELPTGWHAHLIGMPEIMLISTGGVCQMVRHQRLAD